MATALEQDQERLAPCRCRSEIRQKCRLDTATNTNRNRWISRGCFSEVHVGHAEVSTKWRVKTLIHTSAAPCPVGHRRFARSPFRDCEGRALGRLLAEPRRWCGSPPIGDWDAHRRASPQPACRAKEALVDALAKEPVRFCWRSTVTPPTGLMTLRSSSAGGTPDPGHDQRSTAAGR